MWYFLIDYLSFPLYALPLSDIPLCHVWDSYRRFEPKPVWFRRHPNITLLATKQINWEAMQSNLSPNKMLVSVFQAFFLVYALGCLSVYYSGVSFCRLYCVWPELVCLCTSFKCVVSSLLLKFCLVLFTVGTSVSRSGLDDVSFTAAQLLHLLHGLSLFPQ